MKQRAKNRLGNATIEFTLVGIPVMFALISIFEISRGMWIYSTLAAAVHEGSRFAIVHGKNCGQPPNQCTTTVAQVATRIRDNGVGLIPANLTVTMSTASGGLMIQSVGPSTLSTLLTSNTVFPSGAGATPGNDVVVTASYPFASAIGMFFPGAGTGRNWAPVTLSATSRDVVQF